MSLPLEVISGPFAESAVVRSYPLSFSNIVFIFYIFIFLQSLHQRVTCHLLRRYRLRENSFCQYSDVILIKRRVNETLLPPVVSSNYSLQLVGKPKACRRMHPSSWILFELKPPLPPKVKLAFTFETLASLLSDTCFWQHHHRCTILQH
jgi:hypothetical protein